MLHPAFQIRLAVSWNWSHYTIRSWKYTCDETQCPLPFFLIVTMNNHNFSNICWWHRVFGLHVVPFSQCYNILFHPSRPCYLFYFRIYINVFFFRKSFFSVSRFSYTLPSAPVRCTLVASLVDNFVKSASPVPIYASLANKWKRFLTRS